ncbi:MAG: hypothetical protein ABJE95_38445 [Byssovorax sp.]
MASSSSGTGGGGGGACAALGLVGPADVLVVKHYGLDPLICQGGFFLGGPSAVKFASSPAGDTAIAMDRHDYIVCYPGLTYVSTAIAAFTPSGNLQGKGLVFSGPIWPPTDVTDLDIDATGHFTWSESLQNTQQFTITQRINSSTGPGYSVTTSTLGAPNSPQFSAGHLAVATGQWTQAVDSLFVPGFLDGKHLFPANVPLPAMPNRGLDLDGNGNTYLAGTLSGSVNFGCGILTAAGATDRFFAKINAAGACVYSRRFDGPFKIGVDGAGDAMLFATFSGTIDLGGGPLVSVGIQDLAVTKLDPQGNLLWSESFGGPGGAVTLNELSVSASGETALTGTFTGAVDFGSGPVTPPPGCNPTFVMKLGPSGSVDWTKFLNNPGPLGVALNSAGAVMLISASNTLDVGSGPVLTSPGVVLAQLVP